MNDKDTKLLAEAYEQMDEGFLDRVKANVSAGKSGLKGLGQRIAGTAKGALAGAKGDTAGVQAAQQQVQQGKAMGMNPKVVSIANTHIAKIEKAINDLNNDLSKMGMDPNKMREYSPEAAAAIQALQGAANNLKSRLQSGKSVGTAIAGIPGQVQNAPIPGAPQPQA